MSILTIRSLSGLSGDMILAGLLCLTKISAEDLEKLIAGLNLPIPSDCVRLETRSINHISGFGCQVNLPHEHSHRTFKDISQIILSSNLEPEAQALALRTFKLLAQAEGRVHNRSEEDVNFHEVGALDSILDICLGAALLTKLNPSQVVCSPLPLADGSINCAHGIIPAPAPAVLQLLSGVQVCGFKGVDASGSAETVTPTAIAILKSIPVRFDLWPPMLIQEQALVYGSRVFNHVANGAIFAYGQATN